MMWDPNNPLYSTQLNTDTILAMFTSVNVKSSARPISVSISPAGCIAT